MELVQSPLTVFEWNDNHDDLKESFEITRPYVKNAQVVIAKEDFNYEGLNL